MMDVQIYLFRNLRPILSLLALNLKIMFLGKSKFRVYTKKHYVIMAK